MSFNLGKEHDKLLEENKRLKQRLKYYESLEALKEKYNDIKITWFEPRGFWTIAADRKFSVSDNLTEPYHYMGSGNTLRGAIRNGKPYNPKLSREEEDEIKELL